jgi:hypothetical protein
MILVLLLRKVSDFEDMFEGFKPSFCMRSETACHFLKVGDFAERIILIPPKFLLKL